HYNVTLKRIFKDTKARYYVKGFNVTLFESNIDFLNNHRQLKNVKFRFNPMNYTHFLTVDFNSYKNNFSDYPLFVLDNFYSQLSIQYKINIGT
ncbi:hypothetical protein, partial [Salmonella sp. s59944]|uniref:hypothetical protein n=1 Tax=Salmonella sp. s59944 TaxID=3159720 RepID=UPI003980CF55